MFNLYIMKLSFFSKAAKNNQRQHVRFSRMQNAKVFAIINRWYRGHPACILDCVDYALNKFKKLEILILKFVLHTSFYYSDMNMKTTHIVCILLNHQSQPLQEKPVHGAEINPNFCLALRGHRDLLHVKKI